MIVGLFVILSMSAQVNFKNKSFLKEVDKWQKGAKVVEYTDVPTSKMGKYFTVTKADELKGYAYVGRVNSCRAGGCDISGPDSESDFEYFDYFVLTDTAGAVVKVSIYNYQATYGEEVTAKSWLKQFIGYKGEKRLVVGKEIDGITGATSSVSAITGSVQDVVSEIKSFVK